MENNKKNTEADENRGWATRFVRSKTYLRLCTGLIVLVATVAILGKNLIYSFSDSVGAHLFWRTQCKASFDRWDIIELPLKENDYKYVQASKKGNSKMIKLVGCLGGEKIVRTGKTYSCVSPDGSSVDLGEVKFASKSGVPITPFNYNPNEPRSEYTLGEKEFLPVGKPHPDSYDGRYLGPFKNSEVVGCATAIF
jgi:type IV secretory pathway protease TraF